MVKLIDFDRFMMSELRYQNVDSSLYLETGANCRAYQEHNILIWIFLSDRRYIKAFYRLNFRLQTLRVLEI